MSVPGSGRPAVLALRLPKWTASRPGGRPRPATALPESRSSKNASN